MRGIRAVRVSSRAEARSALRGAVEGLGRPLRVLAEDISGLDRALDLVCADPAGRVVLVLLGAEGEDLELVAEGLAQRAWLEPRLDDWRKLAPGLDVRPELGVGILLVAPDFGARARQAARAAPGIGLARVRFVATAGGDPARETPVALLERLESPHAPAAEARPGAAPPPGTDRTVPDRATSAAPHRRPAFRTGLSEADLRPARPGA